MSTYLIEATEDERDLLLGLLQAEHDHIREIAGALPVSVALQEEYESLHTKITNSPVKETS